jgi:hypothetical protein
MRLRWCASALRDLLRRWAVYIVAGLAMLGAFSAGALSSMSAAAAWSVLPLFRAAAQPWWQGWVTGLAHGLIGAGVAWAPRSWREQEAALPIAPRARLASDLAVTALGLLPLWAVYAAGSAVWLAHAPAWLDGRQAIAVAGVLGSMLVSLVLGTAAVQALRRPARAARRGPSSVGTGGSGLQHRAVFAATSWWPLWRGAAARAGRFIPAAALGLVLLAAAPLRWGHGSWWLAGFGLAGLAATVRLHALLRLDLAPLHAACVQLPIAPRRLSLGRRLLALLPALAGLLALPWVWRLDTAPLRPGLAGFYLAAALAGHGWLVAADPEGAQEQAGRWLFTLVLLTAIASEVYA